MNLAHTIAPAARDEQTETLHLVFRHLSAKERPTRVANALALLQNGELDPAGLLAARGPRGLVGALVCMTAPGASSLLWPPQVVPGSPDAADIEDALVRQASDWLRQRGARLAQTLLPADEVHLAAPLLRNGFVHVTCLWYMRHDLELSAALLATPERLTYCPYSRDPARFQETLPRTYMNSRDCPEVTGVRTVEEIVAGHQAQGVHAAARWWLALAADHPIGVLLLTEMPEWNGWDISYVGVVPEARRHGWGHELIRKAIVETRLTEATQLTLSVDARNQPAWRLYRRLGFEAYDQREVYLAIWRRASEGQ